MKRIPLLTVLLALFIFTGCSSGSDDDDMGPPDNGDTEVTYNGTIKAIINGNCIGCHSSPPANGAPMSLTTYQDVRSAVQSRGLIGAVESGAMPPVGSDLTNAQVQAIKDWQADGFPE
jgi:mono/diheme cytochrome c family protein